MRSKHFIDLETMRRTAILSTFFLLIFAFAANAKSLATITIGDKTAADYSVVLRRALSKNFTLVDEDLAAAAFASFKFATPANLSISEASAAGEAMGCDAFLLISAGTIRRTSFEKPVYFESYASIFVVDTRSGRLLKWLRPYIETPAEEDGLPGLLKTLDTVAGEITRAIQDERVVDEAFERSTIEVLPDTSEKGLRSPIPYSRIKPLYTDAAEKLGIAATVEILVDIDAAGKILGTKIVRWAGYGLDKSVEDAVRKMNWRPAYRSGKPVEMRVLLRYNFKRLELPRS